jgi:hypothetical protein
LVTVIVALAASGFLSTRPAVAHGSYWHHCRTPHALPIGSLRAHDVGCGKARRTLAGFYRKAQSEGPGVNVASFCTAVKGGVVCSRGARKIRRADGSSCAGFRFTARLDHRRWRFIVTDVHVPGKGVTCPAAKKTIKSLIRTHSVPGLKCEVGRPAWDAEDHAYWSGYCLDPDGGKTTWQVEEYQLGISVSALPVLGAASAHTTFHHDRLRPGIEGTTSCSNAGTPEDLFLADITTRRVPCKAARRFIVALHAARPDFKKEVTYFRSFTCSPSPEGVAVHVRCVEGRRLIRWLNGT